MIFFSFCFILKPCNTQYNRCTSNRSKKTRVHFYLYSKTIHFKWPETFFAHFLFQTIFLQKKLKPLQRFLGRSLKWPFKRGKNNATRALWCKYRAFPASLTFLHCLYLDTGYFIHSNNDTRVSVPHSPWWSVYKLLRYDGALCLCEKDINRKEPLLSRLKSPSGYVIVWYKIFTLHKSLCDINRKEPLLSRLKSPSGYVIVWYKIFTLHKSLC